MRMYQDNTRKHKKVLRHISVVTEKTRRAAIYAYLTNMYAHISIVLKNLNPADTNTENIDPLSVTVGYAGDFYTRMIEVERGEGSEPTDEDTKLFDSVVDEFMVKNNITIDGTEL